MTSVSAAPLINVVSAEPAADLSALTNQPEVPPAQKSEDLPTTNDMPKVESVGMSQSSTADPVLHGLPEQTRAELNRIEKQFDLGPEFLRRIVDQFVTDIRLGLSKYGEPMAMIPTYVTGVPDGTETG